MEKASARVATVVAVVCDADGTTRELREDELDRIDQIRGAQGRLVWLDITDPKQTIKVHLEKPPKWY